MDIVAADWNLSGCSIVLWVSEDSGDDESQVEALWRDVPDRRWNDGGGAAGACGEGVDCGAEILAQHDEGAGKASAAYAGDRDC
jgi:hypothetical protein